MRDMFERSQEPLVYVEKHLGFPRQTLYQQLMSLPSAHDQRQISANYEVGTAFAVKLVTVRLQKP